MKSKQSAGVLGGKLHGRLMQSAQTHNGPTILGSKFSSLQFWIYARVLASTDSSNAQE